jgi:site-specific DNA-methyltransferase (adenine-specific)
MSARILTGDCRDLMGAEGPFDLIIADPPYGDTALEWDRKVRGWELVAAGRLKASGSVWVFGSMRYFLEGGGQAMADAGFRYVQDVVWEKHNGTGFAADRFKRVHELAVQFRRAGVRWGDVFNDVQRVPHAGPDKGHIRTSAVRVPHTGEIGAHVYDDDGLRICRSVLKLPSVRGGIHPTEKPVALLELLIRTSCPAGGLVGDFFAGSGAAGDAAAMAGRSYVGCEIDPQMAARARERLAGALFA